MNLSVFRNAFRRGAAFTPLTYSPSLWLDATDSSTITKDASDFVSKWDDKSGNNNYLEQLTGANQPKWISSGFGTSSSSNLLFTGGNKYMTLPSTLNLATNFTIFTVVRPNQDTPSGSIGWNDGGVNDMQYFLFAAGTDIRVDGVAARQTTNLTNTDALAMADYDGVNARSFVNDSAPVSVAATGNFTLTQYGNSSIGANYYFTGEVVELIIYPTKLADADTTIVKEYIQLKHGI